MSACIATCGVAAAQGGPPMITDDTETVPKGHWEINTAFTMERISGSRLFGLPLIDVNYGTGRNTQIKLEIPWLALSADGQRTISGLGNTNIGVRWRFRDEDEKHRVAVSMYPQIEFNNPTSSVRRGLVGQGSEFLLPIQWQAAIGNFSLGGDFGFRFRRGPTEMIYGIVVGTELSDRIQVMGEIHGSGPAGQLRDSEVVFNFGSRIKLDTRSNLIFSAGRSIRSQSDPRFVGYLGLQINF